MLLSELVKIYAVKQNKSNDLAYQELLKSQIIAFNTVLIRQNYKKTSVAQALYIQTVKRVGLITIGDGLDNKVLRTKNHVPTPLILDRKSPFINVNNGVDGKNRVSISYINSEEQEYSQYRRFTSNSVFYTYESGYIYIHNSLRLEQISIRSVFNNPFEIPIFAEQECDCEDNHISDCLDNNDLELTEYNAGLILSSFTTNEDKS